MRTLLALLFSAALLPAQCVDYWHSPEQAKKDLRRPIGKAWINNRWIPYSGQVRIGHRMVAYTEWVISSEAKVQGPISFYRDYRFVGRVCEVGSPAGRRL